MLEYSDYVTIKIIKVKDELGQFSHWESETKFSDNMYVAEITNIQTNKSSTVFCTCTTDMIPTCISKNTCIKYP